LNVSIKNKVTKHVKSILGDLRVLCLLGLFRTAN